MNHTEMAALLAAINRFDNREVTEDTVIAWHIAIGDLDFADAEVAVARHFGHSTDYLMPAHIRAGVKQLRIERAETRGDVGPGHSRHIPVADPDDWRAYLAALRAGQTYDADEMTPTGRPELALVAKALPPGEEDEDAPSLRDRLAGPLRIECPTCQAPTGRECHTNAAAGTRRRTPHGARRRAARGEHSAQQSA